MTCSIAMSTYNGGVFLSRQLDSIFAQTHPVDEIVVSDDASGDDTLKILRRYQEAHPEVSWKIMPSEQNQGFRASFMRAICACTGDLIFLCDQDDVWMPHKVERTLSLFEQHPQILSLISDFKTIDAKDIPLHPDASAENLWVSNRVMFSGESLNAITLCEMLGRNQGQGCATAIRRSLAREYEALGKVWTHDWILNFIAAMHGGLYYLREQLISYRLHGSNVIGMAQGEHAQRRIPFVRKLYEFALAAKYSLLEGSGEECRKTLLSVTMDKYDYVFEHVPCGEAQKREIAAWKAFQQRRLSLIEQRRPVAYLLFFLKNRRFFSELAYFATYEQFVIRLMMDLCAILKK